MSNLDSVVVQDPTSGYYFVAMLDILGQRDVLKQHMGPHESPESLQAAMRDVQEAVRPIIWLRNNLRIMRERYNEATKDVHDLIPQYPDFRLEGQSFGDTAVFFTRLYRPNSPDSPLMPAVAAGLRSVALVFLEALAAKVPLRGAVEVEIGTDVFRDEVYGQCLCATHLYESERAKYVRVVAGPELRRLVRSGRHLPPLTTSTSLDRRFAETASGLLTQDSDGETIVDYLGTEVRKGDSSGVFDTTVQKAYSFVKERERFWLEKSNKDRAGKYSFARAFFERKRPT
ncbi:MAG: hypothetical protein NTX53_20770 [candidate division WOR-3 bacterium]|nr:hypothetical protein [candidate division WOR-3 bacterium]